MSTDIFLSNDEVVSFFTGQMSLISASVESFQIFQQKEIVIIDLSFRLLYAKGHRNFRIRFKEVTQYCFYYHSDYIFYNVASVKFFKDEGSFYISLDPDDSASAKSELDNDFIISKDVEAFSII
jgi:hypothetical protein